MIDPFDKKIIRSSRKRRIAAFIIDHFTMSFVTVAIVFLSLGTDFMDTYSASEMFSRMLPAMGIGFFLYVAKDAIKGTSLGKWILGIQVRDETDPTEIPSFKRLFLRNLFLLIWPVEFIALASNSDRRRLGDKKTKTGVFKSKNSPKTAHRFAALAGIGIAYVAFLILFIGITLKNSDAYDLAIQEIEQHETILKETGGIQGYGILPTGSLSVSDGYGTAKINIHINGTKNDMKVRVYLSKEPGGNWQIQRLTKSL